MMRCPDRGPLLQARLAAILVSVFCALAFGSAPLVGESILPESEIAADTTFESWGRWLQIAATGTGGAAAATPPVVADSFARPGDVARIAIPGALAPQRVELRSGLRVLASARPISVRMTGLVTMSVALIGIDSTVEPGTYALIAVNEDGSVAFEREFEVHERSFHREEIVLTASLTSLRRDPDPRKAEQTRVLSDLILSHDPNAFYHSGTLHWPLPSDTRRTSLFGARRTYLYTGGERAHSIHVGLDFASPVGTPVVSAGRGVVRMAQSRIVTGNTVVVEHLPGVFSLYYHLDEIRVEEGVLVAGGQEIGTVGDTGLATGPHLHWEMRVGGVPVSPEDLMDHPLLLGLLAP